MQQVEVTGQLLDSLKCQLCNELLSFPPITLHASIGSVCGRCSSLETEQTIEPLREVTYENLAKHLLLFPCRYSNQGCVEVMLMQKVPEHEKICLYKPFLCPFLPFGNCAWQGTREECKMHFAMDHSHLFLNECIFEVNICEDNKFNRVFTKHNTVFILHTEFCLEESFFYCCVIKLICTDNKNYKYCLGFKRDDGSLDVQLKYFQVRLYNENLTRDDGYKISVSSIMETLNNPTIFTCTVQVFEENKMFNITEEEEQNLLIEKQILTAIKCPVCQECMTAPIYQCEAGHSICETCTPQLQRCPQCRDPVRKKRNYNLEELTDFITYQCKYRMLGCKHHAINKDIKEHEKICKFSQWKCPYSEFFNCSWTGFHNAIIPHVKSRHSFGILEEPLIINFLYDYSSNKGIKYLTHNQNFLRIFELIIEIDKDARKVYATVLYLGPSVEAEQYMYLVEIVDLTNRKLQCTSQKYCGGILDCKYDIKHCSVWLLDMIEPFMSNNNEIKMKFKIRKT